VSGSIATRPEVLEFLGAPWKRGGRDLVGGIDCLGLVLTVLARLNIPSADPWVVLHAAWLDGTLDVATGFPTGWRRLTSYRQVGLDGDVLILTGHEPRKPHVAVVLRGYVLHINDEQRSFALAWGPKHPRPDQAWRYAP